MSDLNKVDQAPARLIDLFLHRVRYKALGGTREEGATLSSHFLLSTRLFSDRTVGVEFGVSFRSVDVAVQVIYRLHFDRGPSANVELSDEQFARQVAAQLAPIIAFPFVRETVASLTGKSGESMLLPIVNVGAMFSPEDIVISRADSNQKAATSKAHGPRARKLKPDAHQTDQARKLSPRSRKTS